MNEWSPGGIFSRPPSLKQQPQCKSYRSSWECQTKEVLNKPLVVNIRAVSDSRSRELRGMYSQRSIEEIPKNALSTPAGKKRRGISDPRFKRVLSAGLQNDACVGTELKNKVESAKFYECKPESSEVPLTATIENVQKRDRTPSISPGMLTDESKYSNYEHTEVSTFDTTMEHLKEVDKFSFSPDNFFPKKSISDCTVRTGNTSLVSDDIGDELIARLQSYPSTTRVVKVHNWMKDHRPRPEKRRSVITVIGQTQGKSSLSTTLHEIDQRRKLAKELDKHAICKKILESPKRERTLISVPKVGYFPSSTSKILYAGDKACVYSESQVLDRGIYKVTNYGDGGERIHESDTNNGSEFYETPEPGTGSPRKRLSKLTTAPKVHSERRSALKQKYDFSGKFRYLVGRLTYQPLIYFLVTLSGALCWFAIFALQETSPVRSYTLFSSKPRAMTWYEELFHWIWEFFRPSSSYKRSTPWNSH